jgi:hypothetical protein
VAPIAASDTVVLLRVTVVGTGVGGVAVLEQAVWPRSTSVDAARIALMGSREVERMVLATQRRR